MLELRHLRYFIAVAEEQNFNRAAERVHIDQTPLARAMRDLEDQLGVSLLVRTPRRLHLTPAGSELLGHARLLLVRLERVKRAVRSKAQHHRSLRIAIADGIAQPHMTHCLQTWQSVYPDAPLELLELRADQLVAALRREEADVGFCFGAPHHEAIEQRVAWAYPVRAILPAGHVLARRRELSIAELLAYPTVTCDASAMPGLRRQMDELQRAHACVRLHTEEATTLAGYLTRVAAGIGVADVGHLQACNRGDLVAVPLLEEFSFHTYVLHRRQPVRSPDAVLRFVDHALSSEPAGGPRPNERGAES